MRAANGTAPDAVVKALEGVDFKDSLLGPLKFRECDHVAETPMFIVEGKDNSKYKLFPSYIEHVSEPNALAIACGQTGCEVRVRA
jgi:hypothetical protein